MELLPSLACHEPPLTASLDVIHMVYNSPVQCETRRSLVSLPSTVEFHPHLEESPAPKLSPRRPRAVPPPPSPPQSPVCLCLCGFAISGLYDTWLLLGVSNRGARHPTLRAGGLRNPQGGRVSPELSAGNLAPSEVWGQTQNGLWGAPTLPPLSPLRPTRVCTYLGPLSSERGSSCCVWALPQGAAFLKCPPSPSASACAPGTDPGCSDTQNHPPRLAALRGGHILPGAMLASPPQGPGGGQRGSRPAGRGGRPGGQCRRQGPARVPRPCRCEWGSQRCCWTAWSLARTMTSGCRACKGQRPARPGASVPGLVSAPPPWAAAQWANAPLWLPRAFHQVEGPSDPSGGPWPVGERALAGP